ncbi:MAG TPA: serine/threonine-protein kinase [Gemmatimonadaceae bacterium]|nr:serine/threonine-protein kinase [Gemmatimonadaceae bacterium]
MTDTAEFSARSRALAPDFTLEREIGRGGMGIVYLGVDVKLDRRVAIKVLPEALSGEPEVRERFLREARTAAKLTHPGIVPIYRADETDGVVFIVMAYIDGVSLADRLSGAPTLPSIRETCRILRDVALALDYAHAHGVVHRDIKPENILVEGATGRAWVTDFGIARLAEAKPLTATGQVLGTVHYMSPEQISGETVDGRSDLYSLGVVGFRALTGRLPFDSETASAVLVAHVVKQAPKVRDVAPHVPRALAALIDRCLAKDAALRCESGGTFARELDDIMLELTDGDEPEPTANAVISEREARALWSRAAELQAFTGAQPRPSGVARATALTDVNDRRTLTSGYRLDDARAAALEAGISERYVERAAAELGLAGTAPNVIDPAVHNGTPKASIWSGSPMSILYEVEVVGEVPESEMYILVDTIRRRIGEAGHAGTIGRSVSWSSASKNRNLQVAIVSRHGKTSIRVDERLSPLAGGLFGGIMGGLGGGSAGVAFGIGAGALHSVAIAFGIWGTTIAGSYVLARTIYGAQVRKRLKALGALTEELAQQARDAIKLLPRGA